MTAPFFQHLLAAARRTRISTLIVIVFTCALTLPWFVFVWLTAGAYTAETQMAERNLAALAAAYGEHAAAVAKSVDAPELAQFRRALHRDDVQFALRRSGAGEPDRATKFTASDGLISAEVRRPDGLTVVASQSKASALSEWRRHSTFETLGLLARTLIGSGIGVFLVRQLRWRERAQAELAVARQAAEASSHAKSEFLANMSHELRTPLNAIIGFSEVIKLGMVGPLSARYRDYGTDIFNSGTHLLHLINEILDLSKLEAGKLELEENSVDVAALVRSSIRLVEPQAAKAKVALSAAVPDGIGQLRADERRMRQILINLLSNAAKFTPEGGRVRVSVAQWHGGLTIDVCDTGIGMTQTQIATALEPFGQVRGPMNRQHDGTGLGLPLAVRLVELHGGTLTVTSEVNFGTTVTITLPPERMLADEAPERLAAIA